METGSHRGRMRDHAVMVLMLLQEHRRISISRIAEELGASELTARRWVDSFSDVIPLRLERGVVIVDELARSRRSEAATQKAVGAASSM
jgi:DeoR/GlpR family transcriptional regulator of sugar metabolism